MHLEKPWLNNIGQGKKKLNKKQQRAKEEHDKFLRSKGLHPDQRSEKRLRKDDRRRWNAEAETTSASSRRVAITTSNQIPPSAPVQGVMANLHKEKPSVQRAILEKAKRVEPLYNKGGLQYVTDGTDPTTLGSKSRRS